MVIVTNNKLYNNSNRNFIENFNFSNTSDRTINYDYRLYNNGINK